MRSVEELLSDDDAWGWLVDAVASSNGRCVLLDPDDVAGECLYRLQVTTRSVLGALAYHCGGLLIDRGWVRLLGAGHGGLPSLASYNDLTGAEAPAFLVIGFDVLGGRFAINGGGLVGEPGLVCFWAPDTLEWQSLGIGHGDFVAWLIDGGSSSLYDSLRWPGWQRDVALVGLDQSMMLYPPPITTEGRDVSVVSRRAVPRPELDAWLNELAGLPDGPFRVRIDPSE